MLQSNNIWREYKVAIKEQLQSDLADAMREGDQQKRDTLRLLLSAVKQAEVDGQKSLDDDGVQAILNKQAKQRRESIEEYNKADRTDLAAQEKLELDILESYLPQQMSRAEISELAIKTISQVGASNPQDMGKVMGRLMPQVKGRADGRLVNEVVRELLTG